MGYLLIDSDFSAVFLTVSKSISEMLLSASTLLPSAVVPPGVVTAVMSSCGVCPVSRTIFAAPRAVWAESVSAVS